MWNDGAVSELTLDSDKDFLIYCRRLDGNIEILDIAVNSERRQGKGTKLLKKLRVIAGAYHTPRCHMITAITRLSNTIAHEFYEANRFRIVGRLHNYYADEDGLHHALLYGLEL